MCDLCESLWANLYVNVFKRHEYRRSTTHWYAISSMKATISRSHGRMMCTLRSQAEATTLVYDDGTAMGGG